MSAYTELSCLHVMHVMRFGKIDIDIGGKRLHSDKNHDSHSRHGSGRGLRAKVDQ